MMRPTQVLREVLTAACVLAAAATGCEEKVTQPEKTVVAPTVVATSTAPAQERQWSFRGQRGITAAFTPTDLTLYRSLLPKQFDMPQSPLAAVAVVYYYDVTLPLTPYHEGYVLLQCQYQGETGWYVLTMPLDDETANLGGRALGFPKYIANKIVLDEGLGSWSGGVSYQGRIVMGVGFAPDGSEPVTASSSDPGLPVFLLVPPAEGPQINQIGMDLAGERQTITTSGTATIEADAGEPWAGLLPAKGTAVWGQLQQMTGDWVLTAKQR
jgi:Acetoacetate decarboxylase (ADC)